MDLHTVSPLEQVLAQFWDDTLGTTVSGRLTDFFEAGADDVAAERLLSRVGETFHLDIPLAALRAGVRRSPHSRASSSTRWIVPADLNGWPSVCSMTPITHPQQSGGGHSGASW